MEKFFYKNVLIGIRIKAFRNGSNPATDAKEPLQVLMSKHKKKHSVKAHIHSPHKRIIWRIQECLMMKKGKIKVDFYTPDKKYFKSIYLKQGEALILAAGGHGVTFLEDSEIIEVKSGPFQEDKIFI